MPLGASKIGLMAAAAGGGNYFGDGSDGANTTTGDETFTVNGTTKDMTLKQYTTLTVSSGDTMSVSANSRGLFIYVQGDCVINGTLSMSSGTCSGLTGGAYRGENFDPTSNTTSSDGAAVSATGLRLPLLTAAGSETLAAADFAGCGTAVVNAVANQVGISGNGNIFQLAATGGAGGASVSDGACSMTIGNTGTASSVSGTTLTAAGGSSGEAMGCGATRSSGNGGQGSCFGGGGGTGGTTGSIAHSGSPNWDASWSGATGGYVSGEGWWGQKCGNGGGGAGTLILIVGGDLTIGASGSIQANGGGGGSSGASERGDGGGGAGGNVLVCYAGTLTNSGSIAAAGGSNCGGGASNQAGAVLSQQIL